MTSIGTGYDLYSTTFSPEGRIFQIEYAGKAAENSETSIAVKTKDGVVIAVEKLIRSKMLESTATKRIYNIAPHISMTIAGLTADARQIVNHARHEAREYKKSYGDIIPVKMLCSRLSGFIHYFTLGAARPFGCSSILTGHDDKGTQIYMIEPSGESWGYFGTAVGKGQQAAKTELEKLNLQGLTCREAAKELAQIVYKIHDDIKDKKFELEMSWICEETNYVHKFLPQDLLDEVRAQAIEATSDGIIDSSDDEMD